MARVSWPALAKASAAAMPLHVAVNGEIEAGARADPLDQTIGGIRREWRAALGRKDVARLRELPARPRGGPFTSDNTYSRE
jgi:hypothetical protein